MIATMLLALLGMGIAAAALVIELDEDEEDDASADDSVTEEASARALQHLDALDLVNATSAGEIFAAEEPRGESGHVSVIEGFDTEQDIVGFDLEDLARNCFDNDSLPHFNPDAALDYDLTVSEQSDPAGTLVSLSLFDAADTETEPVYYDVLLSGITFEDVSEDNVSVVTGQQHISDAQGGERAAVLEGSSITDALSVTSNTELVTAGAGDDVISGTGTEAFILAGAGNDTVEVSGSGLDVYGGSGNDSLTVLSDTAGTPPDADIFGGAGDDTINTDLGSYIEGGAGTDDITISVHGTPLDGQPLELWRQPLEDDRFSAHSTVVLQDADDTVRLNLDPAVPGNLHQVRLTEETFGENAQEVYTREYTLIIWTPADVTDISSLVTGSGSAFNSSFAQDNAIGDPAYEAVVDDPTAPRVLLTLEHGESYTGDFDDFEATFSGGYDNIHEANLILNREVTSIHTGEVF